MDKPRVTLALGGGGARGLSHLGVIEVLLAAGFEIERIVGVSIGSLAGALFAFDQDIKRVQQKSLAFLLSPTFQKHQQTLFGSRPSRRQTQEAGGLFTWYSRVQSFLRANSLFRRVITRPSMLPGIVLQEVVDHLLPEQDISETRIPLSIAAVDLITGHQVVLEKGPVREAVRASASIPGIFPPVDWGGMQLCDVGVMCTLPTIIARTYQPSFLLAVDVSSSLIPIRPCQTAIDVLIRIDEIGEHLFRKHVRDSADLIIEPNVAHVEWFDFSAADELIESGHRAMQAAMPKLLAKVARQRE